MVSIGIDLGTVNSCVAVCRNETVEVIANDLGIRITPSYVTFDDRKCLVGSAAKTQLTRKPEQTVFDVKLLLGLHFDDPFVKRDVKNWPFTVVEMRGKPRVLVEYKKEKKTFAPEEISAMVLRKMKETAEKFLGVDVEDAVIAVPVYFNVTQRQATVNAGKIAGLNVLRIVNEPTAAALAYVHGHTRKDEMNVLVFDLGSRHLNVAVVQIGNESRRTVKASAGGTHMGGADFDSLLLNHLANEFMGANRKDVFANKKALQRLRAAAEVAKVTLTSLPMAYIEIDALVDGIDFTTSVTREFFESLCNEMFTKIMIRVEKVISIAKFINDDIDRVVMVGGSSRIPKVQEMLEAMFPGRLNLSVNLDEAVASGAALLAAHLTQGSSSKIKEILDFDGYQPEGFTPRDVAEMIADAKAQRDDDKYEKDREDARHHLEKFAYQTKSRVSEVDPQVDQLCDEALSWIGENETIDRKSLELRLDSLQEDVNARLQGQAQNDNQARREEQARFEEQARRGEQARIQEQARREEQARIQEQEARQKEHESSENARLMAEARLVQQSINEKQARLKEQTELDEMARQHEQYMRQEQERLKEKARLLEITLREEQLRREEQNRFIEQAVREQTARHRQEEEAARRKNVENVKEPLRENIQTADTSDSLQGVIVLKCDEDKEDEQTTLARNQLKNFITLVLSEMKRDDSNFRVKGCLAFIEHCEDIKEEISKKGSNETKEELNGKQKQLHDQYLEMKAKIKEADVEKRREMLREEQDLETQRITARRELEDYIEKAKDEMFKYEFSLRNQDWDEFVNYCFKTFSWVCNNDRATKEMFDAELYSMIRKHADAEEKLKEHKNNVEKKAEPKKSKSKFPYCVIL